MTRKKHRLALALVDRRRDFAELYRRFPSPHAQLADFRCEGGKPILAGKGDDTFIIPGVGPVVAAGWLAATAAGAVAGAVAGGAAGGLIGALSEAPKGTRGETDA